MRCFPLIAAALAVAPPALGAMMLSDAAVAELLEAQHIEARQATNAGITTSNGTVLDMAAWERETNSICAARLSTLDQATNPSGSAICYNIPMFNNQTGHFMADLRLYKISDPTGTFLGILPQNVQVGLAYNGATVRRVSNTTVAAASNAFVTRSEGMLEGLATGHVVRRASDPQLLQLYLFIGQIDQTKMAPDMAEAQIEALIIPTLTLSGVNPAGQTVQTHVSPNEASFIIGAFSDLTFQSPFSKAAERVKAKQQQLRDKEIAFVLPGVQILIFPIGLVITSIWLVVGAIAYAFGTYQRYQYAHSFKTRQMALSKQGGRTF